MNAGEMDIPLLQDIVVIFGLAVAVLWVCTWLRLPTLVGFLVTGIISGPHGLGLVRDAGDVEILSRIGVVLLLFSIGLEFSFKRLLEIKRYFLIGGGLQVLFTALIGLAIGLFFGRPLGESIFLGCLLSLSSTAIVLKALESHDETDSPHGRLSIGVLIFQDIAAVPMVLLVPVLGEAGGETFRMDFLVQLFVGLVVVVAVFFAAIKLVPKLLYQIAKMRNHELFFLSVLMICFAVAWLTSSIGLSLALGAFLAGLIVSESEYSHEVIGNVIPLQDIFSSLFFVSIGMLFDVHFLLQQPFFILLVTAIVLFLKGSVVALVAGLLGLTLRTMLLSAVALSQIGEFAFVLMRTGIDYGLGNTYYYQLFLAVAILTMAVTPSLIAASSHLLRFAMYLPWPRHWKDGLSAVEAPPHHYTGHIVIVGFGIAGRNLAHACKANDIPYLILEMNPETVRHEKARGEPIHFGDGSHESVLKHLHMASAKAVAVMINDRQASRRIVALSRLLNPTAYLIVRTRYMQECEMMRQLGANEVIPDEFGSSIEVLTHVLNHFHVPTTKIQDIVTLLRAPSF